ncbi:MAG: TauD/TfdA family dioxygenase [Lautropia sp.]
MTLAGSWLGPQIDYRREGLHVFTEADVGEIDRALAHLRGLGDLDFPEITPQTFPLERVGADMTSLRQRLLDGRGFVLLRGIPRARYDVDDMARIYFGLGSHLGVPMVQSHLGDLLGHVIDVSDLEPRSRGYRKGGGQEMHADSTDLCDIVGLMCLRRARSGGASRISSALAVWQSLQQDRPDLAEVLRRGYYFRRGDADGEQAQRWQSEERIAAFAESDGRVSCYLVGSYPRRAAAAGGRPLSALEAEALAEAERRAASPSFYLDMSFDEGDIQFLNNRIILHGRTDYVDDPALSQRRHLMRLWLRVPSWPALPPQQVFNTPAEQQLWAGNRHRLAELPSVHLQHLAGLARSGTADT